MTSIHEFSLSYKASPNVRVVGHHRGVLSSGMSSRCSPEIHRRRQMTSESIVAGLCQHARFLASTVMYLFTAVIISFKSPKSYDSGFALIYPEKRGQV